MRVSQMAHEFNITYTDVINSIQLYKPGEYNINSLLSDDIVYFLRTKYKSLPNKKISSKELIINKIEKLHNKVDFEFKFLKNEIEENQSDYDVYKKNIYEISHLKFRKNKYAQLDDLEIYRLIKFKVKQVLALQKKIKKLRKEDAIFNDFDLINTNNDFDQTDYNTPFDNPWNNVFGEGQEASDAYWNTD